MEDLKEVGQTADTVRAEIEQLFVRGINASSSSDRRALATLTEEWDRLGAGHVASRLTEALRGAEAGAATAPRAFLSAYTSLHVFERLISQEVTVETWSRHIDALDVDNEDDEGETGERADAARPQASPKAGPALLEDPKGTLSLAEELSGAVEDLVRTGLTSATESTRAKLDASFKEASRRKLLRLGAALRYVNDEVARFLEDDPAFSKRRFVFFLHRSWVQARGLAKGIRDKDDGLLTSLLRGAGAAPRPMASLDVVTIGVLKQATAQAYMFDFKLRIVAANDPLAVGKSLTWSAVFVRPKDKSKDRSIEAEAYLHLPQPQKFPPKIFCGDKTVRITDCAVSFDAKGSGRLMLGPKSTVTEGQPYSDWDRFWEFDPAAVLSRAETYRPGPLDLAVDLQEEVFLTDAEISAKPVRSSDGRHFHSLSATTKNGSREEAGLSFDAAIADGPEGADLLKRLRAGLGGPSKPVLFGLSYCDQGRMVFLPISLYSSNNEPSKTEEEPPAKGASKKGGGAAKGTPKTKKASAAGPNLITISDKKYNISALLGTLNFKG